MTPEVDIGTRSSYSPFQKNSAIRCTRTTGKTVNGSVNVENDAEVELLFTSFAFKNLLTGSKLLSVSFDAVAGLISCFAPLCRTIVMAKMRRCDWASDFGPSKQA